MCVCVCVCVCGCTGVYVCSIVCLHGEGGRKKKNVFVNYYSALSINMLCLECQNKLYMYSY